MWLIKLIAVWQYKLLTENECMFTIHIIIIIIIIIIINILLLLLLLFFFLSSVVKVPEG